MNYEAPPQHDVLILLSHPLVKTQPLKKSVSSH
jgi:hypothetical protein